MIWNDTHENIIVVAALLLILALTTCIGKEATAATVLADGTMVMSAEEIQHCSDGGGCKLITDYQIDILTRYIDQLKADIELLEKRRQETNALKSMVCI